jgi:hypothetical protein
MNQLTELQARNFSLEEIARRLLDHSEPAIRVFAGRVVEAIESQEIYLSTESE